MQSNAQIDLSLANITNGIQIESRDVADDSKELEFYVPGVPLDTFDQLSELPIASVDGFDDETETETKLPTEFDAREAWP
jgi:hypothetical protein